MDRDVVIKAEGLGKEYRLGTVREAYGTLRDTLTDMARRAIRREAAPRAVETIWALRDVSFEVKRGEVLGVIGRNGAGKSTLLKVLSRITAPTTGRVEIRGRIGSLLEVGTGFHPELTGRENIFLNGSIIGMHHAEIKTKFDEIVDFAGVEKFIDTPVKRYSSGMYVRLAFAVAAHLEPEILLVDEVLAVGDAAFQKKCLGKMGEVAEGGRTVLFVSHNMSAVENLCRRVLLLDQGQVLYDGRTTAGVEQYLIDVSKLAVGKADLRERPREGGLVPLIQSAAIRKTADEARGDTTIRTGDNVVIEIKYDCGDRAIDMPQLGVCSAMGQRLLTVGGHLDAEFHDVLSGRGTIRCLLPALPLNAGSYSLTVMFSTRTPPLNVDYVENALSFRVDAGDFFGTGNHPLPAQGPIALRSRWQVVADAEHAP